MRQISQVDAIGSRLTFQHQLQSIVGTKIDPNDANKRPILLKYTVPASLVTAEIKFKGIFSSSVTAGVAKQLNDLMADTEDEEEEVLLPPSAVQQPIQVDPSNVAGTSHASHVESAIVADIENAEDAQKRVAEDLASDRRKDARVSTTNE